MQPLELFFLGWIIMIVVMAILWFREVQTNDASIVDVGWPLGIAGVALLYGFLADGDPLRRALVSSLTALWGIRLGYYLIKDRIVGKPEDGRYQYLRGYWGDKAHRKFFFFFQGQGVSVPILLIPLALILTSARPEIAWWEWLGMATILISIIGETIADRQLATFRANPSNKGKTCREGLWRVSRHPNYFFEWLHWIGYGFMGFSVGAWWPLTWLSAALMYVLIVKVTGIPYTEKQSIRSRGDDYRRYQQETSPFFPWFPKKVGGDA